jgi:hypothetical protein
MLFGYFVVCSVHNLCLIGLDNGTGTPSPDLILSVLNDSTEWKWSSRSVPKPLSVLSSLPNVARAKAWPASLRTDDYDQFNDTVDRA